MRSVLLGPLAVLLLPMALVAQCPDGTPPPCRGAAVRAVAPNSVAVLYFSNLSRDTNDAYLADGLTEEIIERLGSVQRLAVKSRYEVQQARGRAPADVAAVGRTLNAAYLVTGTVQRGGTRVRVRVELIRAATRVRVWGDQFDEPNGDVLAIEAAIGRGVVEGVAGALLPAERASLAFKPTTNAAAYDLYLRGRAAFEREDQRTAIPLLQRAVAEDSTFAPAWALLASAWSESADSWRPPREAYPQALIAARRAIALDSGLAEAWAALAPPTLSLDHDATRAERYARRAIALAPGLPEAHVMLAFTQWALGRGRDAVDAARAGWVLDSTAALTTLYYRLSLILAGDTATLRRHPAMASAPDAQIVLGECEAARARTAGLRGSYGNGTYIRALHCLGRTEAVAEVIDSMMAARAQRYFNPYPVAVAWAIVGKRDSALAWLEHTLDDRTIWAINLPFDPVWDPYRSDERFLALMVRFGLPAARVN